MDWSEFKKSAIKYGAKDSPFFDCVDIKSRDSSNIISFWKHNSISVTIPYDRDINLRSNVTYTDMLTIIKALKDSK